METGIRIEWICGAQQQYLTCNKVPNEGKKRGKNINQMDQIKNVM